MRTYPKAIRMKAGAPHDPQFDLFIPYTADLAFRDTQETMERPFFSLGKRKRLKPIEYTSPDGSVYVKVLATPEFGMASIWDADILIWAASILNAQRKAGSNDIPRTLHFQPYDLLRTIGRETGGREYQLLRDALGRLQSTTIITNIRPKGKKKDRQFSWIESWSDVTNETTGQSQGMTLTVSEWFYEGILLEKNLLALDPSYFSIAGGRERWLYRVARKHAGGAGEEGFAISMRTLFEKSGAEGTYRRFKFEMLAIAQRCHGQNSPIPGYDILVETGAGSDPALRMIRQERRIGPRPANAPAIAGKPVAASPGLPVLTEQTIQLVKRDFPGWDIYAIKADFDLWIVENARQPPENYQKAFYGFARQWHERNRRP